MSVNHIGQHLNFMAGQSVARGVRGPGSQMAAFAPQANAQLNALMARAATFITNAPSQATRLHNTLINMQTVIDAVSAVPSNPSALRVQSFPGGAIPNTEVEISQLAVAQRNSSTTMPADQRNAPQGLHRIEIDVDGEKHEISFTIGENVTNREFKQQMANAINAADIGVTSSVSTINGQSILRVEANETGYAIDSAQQTGATGSSQQTSNNAQRFAIRDLQGGAVNFTGIDNVTREAQNAIFTVDGEERVSASNNVELADGFTVTLLATTEEAVTFSPGTNSSGMINSTRNMVREFNALLETARSNATDSRTRALIRELESIARRNRRQFDEIGIHIDENGLLVMDENRVAAAAANGSLERALGETGGRQSNFVGALTRVTNSVRNTPQRHISTSIARLPGFNTMLYAAANGNTLANEPPPNPFDGFNMHDMLGNWLNALQ